MSLLHTDRQRRFCLRVAMQLVPGNESECPILSDLVDQCVAGVGAGVITRLLLDRGFLDGGKIARCKRTHGIDILIPLRKNMDVYQDALGLVRLPELRFREYTAPTREPVDAPRLPQAPARVRKRELARQQTVAAEKQKRPPPPPPPDETLVRTEVAGMDGFKSWSSAAVGGRGPRDAARRVRHSPRDRGRAPAAEVLLGPRGLHLARVLPGPEPARLRDGGLHPLATVPARCGFLGSDRRRRRPSPALGTGRRNRPPDLAASAARHGERAAAQSGRTTRMAHRARFGRPHPASAAAAADAGASGPLADR